MNHTRLFPDLPEIAGGTGAAPTIREEARGVRPVRNRVRFVTQELDAVLPEDHQARAI